MWVQTYEPHGLHQGVKRSIESHPAHNFLRRNDKKPVWLCAHNLDQDVQNFRAKLGALHPCMLPFFVFVDIQSSGH